MKHSQLFSSHIYKIVVHPAKTASTFDGQIYLIPDMLIDNFEPLNKIEHATQSPIKYCFVSHAHSDHYRGLTRQIHQSPMPKFIMAQTTKYLIFLQTEKTNSINEFEKGLKFVFISNFHCICSVMILLKNSSKGIEKKVLY